MILRCSYFSPNLSLDVLIDLVLIQNNACIVFVLLQFTLINILASLWKTSFNILPNFLDFIVAILRQDLGRYAIHPKLAST